MSDLLFDNAKASDSGYRDADRQIPARVGTPPEPGNESAGPAMFNLVQETKRALEVQSALLRAAIPLLDTRIVVDYATGQADASGNLALKIYQVPQGYQFITTRVNIENGIATPGAPFTAAGAWMGLMRGDSFRPGSLIDFVPNPPGAGGVVLPAIFSDGSSEAGVFRGGEIIGLNFVGTATAANMDIWVRIQGILESV